MKIDAEYHRRYYAANRDRKIAQTKSYQKRHRERHLARRKELRLLNRERENARQSLWRKNNKDKTRVYVNKARKKRMVRDVSFAIRERLRTRIREAFKSQSTVKTGRTAELLGCSIADFRIYIESKFDVGMNWDNWGFGDDKWNLDHIIPCCIFDLSRPDHQKRCFHFSNYQPLWQSDNMDKRAKSCGQLRLI